MIELARHIEILLLDNDCVIVPGLGGFVTHHTPARRVEEENIFLPPYRSVGFSPKMKLNDGLLVQSYMTAYDITYPEAIKLVDMKVDELKAKLQEDGMFTLQGIGTLRCNILGEHSFSPMESGILSPSLYGYSSFEMLTLKALNMKESNEKKAQVIEMEPKASTSIFEDPSKANKPVEDVKINWKATLIAAAVAIICFFAITLPAENGLFGNKKSSEIEAIPAVTVTPIVEQPKVETPKIEEPKAEEVKEEVKVVPQTEYYTIVLACQVSAKNAETYAKMIKDKGFDEVFVIQQNKSNSVLYSRFSTKEEAQQRLSELRGEKEFAQGWIQFVK